MLGARTRTATLAVPVPISVLAVASVAVSITIFSVSASVAKVTKAVVALLPPPLLRSTGCRNLSCAAPGKPSSACTTPRTPQRAFKLPVH